MIIFHFNWLYLKRKSKIKRHISKNKPLITFFDNVNEEEISRFIIKFFNAYKFSSKYIHHRFAQRNFCTRTFFSLTPLHYSFWLTPVFLFSLSHFILNYAGVDRLRVPSSSIISMTFTIFTLISAAGVENSYTVCVFVNKRLLLLLVHILYKIYWERINWKFT